jgi:hypothetical protein
MVRVGAASKQQPRKMSGTKERNVVGLVTCGSYRHAQVVRDSLMSVNEIGDFDVDRFADPG